MNYLLTYAAIGMLLAAGARAKLWADGHGWWGALVEFIGFAAATAMWPVLLAARLFR